MSDSFELANLIKDIRNGMSQGDFAKHVGLGLQTIVRLEKGDSCKYDTLLKIADEANVNDATRTQMIIAWIKNELRDDFKRLDIAPRLLAHKKPVSSSIQDRVLSLLRDRSKKEQELILYLLENPDALRLVPHLQQMVSNIRS